MDYLPELAHDGHNWTAYGSLVLCAIIDDGLMGFLVGSETRPTHPAQLEGRGEGWTPQTDDERDAVAAWRTADQLWTQRNATVNYTIICGIPDTIFGLMLHLKSPHEKWDYLEKRFGSIPRPESWVAAEQGTQQSSSQPEQSAAGETAQGTCDSHDKTLNPPSEEEGFSPNDCAKTETGYPTLETEVVDVQGVESNLPVEEEDLQGNQNAYTEIPTGHLEPETDIVDVQRTEGCSLVVETGITDPEWLDKHANTLKATDERSRCTDDEIAEHRDSPGWSPEAHEPAGDTTGQTFERSIENASIECNEHIPMDGKTVANVPDPPGTHAEPSASHDKRSTIQNRPPARMHGGMVTELRLPCARSKRTSQRLQRTRQRHSTWDSPPDEVWGVGVHRHARTGKGDSADIRSTTTKLEIRATSAQMVDTRAHVGRRPKEPDKGDDGRYNNTVSRDIVNLRSIEKALLIDRECQDSERETKRPDDLPAPHGLPPNGLMHTPKTSWIPHQCCRANTTPINVSGLKTRGFRRLVLSTPISLPREVSKRLWNIADTFRRQDMPHRRTRKHAEPSDSRMAVLQQWRKNTRQDGKCAKLERHGTPVISQVLPPEAGRWGDSGSGDVTSSNTVCSHGAEKKLLADSRGQHSEHGAQRQDGLPASPEPHPNGTTCAPAPYRVPRRRGRIKMRAGSISDAHTRQKAYFTQAAPTRPPLSHFRPMKRLRHTMAGYQTMKKGYNEMRRARKLETRGHMHRTAGILMRLPQLLTDSSKRLRHPTGGLWIQKIGCSEVRHARRVKTRGCTYRTACILLRLLSLLSNTSKRFWNTANTYWRQGVHPRSTRSDEKRPRNCPVARRLPRSSIRRGDAHTSIYSLVLPKRPPDGLTHTPRTLRDHRRRGRIKTEAENVSIVRTRPSAYRTLVVAIRPLRLISTPTDPCEIVAGGCPTLGVRLVTTHKAIPLFRPFDNPGNAGNPPGVFPTSINSRGCLPDELGATAILPTVKTAAFRS